jgi:histidine triad (HIT) family protein
VSPADPTCTICRIVTGALSAEIVLDDPHAVAFLDHRPLFPGHTLVVPRDHLETLPDLPDDELAPFFQAVQRVAAAIPDALDAAGTFVAANNIVSQSVPHLHFHVVPRRPKDGLRGFFWPRRRYETPEEMAEVADRLRRRLQAP